MMPTVPDDEMSLREISHTLTDFRHEWRSQVTQLLRTDVYRAEQEATHIRITNLEKDRDTAEATIAANRRLALGAILTGVISVITALLLIALHR